MKYLLTGHAGFIGFHVARRLLERGDTVIGVDNVNDYYDVTLKRARLAELARVAADSQKNKRPAGTKARKAAEPLVSLKRRTVSADAGTGGNSVSSVLSRKTTSTSRQTASRRRKPGKRSSSRSRSARNPYTFHETDIAYRSAVAEIFEAHKPDRVIHLAAQAGVRYSVTHPHAYADSNLVGFLNILEGCRHNRVEHLTYASSSSVYGANTKLPFSVEQNVDHPVSLYAATKKANELMAHTYSHLYGLPTTGLRFFTVYGPWGRPDMAYFLFTRAIMEDRPIDLFNKGMMQRDFTFIDDIVEGVIRTSDCVAEPDPDWDSANPAPGTSSAPFRLYNIGNNTPVPLLALIGTIEKHLGKTAVKNLLPMQPGDVPTTYADVDALSEAVGFRPVTSIEEGIRRFVEWYQDFYGA